MAVPSSRDRPRWSRPLEEAGMRLNLEDGGDGKHALLHDQAVFSKKLKSLLSGSSNFPENVKKMVEGFTGHLEQSDSALKRALANTETDDKCATARARRQDSLIRILLQVKK
jgi:hypothetical protein